MDANVPKAMTSKSRLGLTGMFWIWSRGLWQAVAPQLDGTEWVASGYVPGVRLRATLWNFFCYIDIYMCMPPMVALKNTCFSVHHSQNNFKIPGLGDILWETLPRAAEHDSHRSAGGSIPGWGTDKAPGDLVGCTKVLSYDVLLSWQFLLSSLEHIYRAPLLPLMPSNEDVQIDSRWQKVSGEPSETWRGRGGFWPLLTI